jgi:hypothetical protein
MKILSIISAPIEFTNLDLPLISYGAGSNWSLLTVSKNFRSQFNCLSISR